MIIYVISATYHSLTLSNLLFPGHSFYASHLAPASPGIKIPAVPQADIDYSP